MEGWKFPANYSTEQYNTIYIHQIWLSSIIIIPLYVIDGVEKFLPAHCSRLWAYKHLLSKVELGADGNWKWDDQDLMVS